MRENCVHLSVKAALVHIKDIAFTSMNNTEPITFLFNELLFFLYLYNIHTVFFYLTNDVRERRNVVYFLIFLKISLNCAFTLLAFIRKVFTQFLICMTINIIIYSIAKVIYSEKGK